MEAQPFGEFASIDLVTLVALFEQWDLAWIADTCGTYLNGARLGSTEGSEEPAAELKSGDVISLGPSHVNTYLFVVLA